MAKIPCGAGNHRNCPNYYWRDYDGTTPDDAITVGGDSNGDPLYIGQAYIRGYELLPVTIDPKTKIGETTAFSSVLRPDKHVKILCSPYMEAFEWVAIDSSKLNNYLNSNVIIGGFEVGENLYIGRVFRDNSALVGKIFRDEVASRGIWFPSGNAPGNSLTYELLLFNCAKIKSCCCC